MPALGWPDRIYYADRRRESTKNLRSYHSHRRPNRWAESPPPVLNDACRRGERAAIVQRSWIIADPCTVDVEPPVSLIEKIFQCKLVLGAAICANLRKHATKIITPDHLNKSDTSKIVATRSIVTVRGPVDEQMRVGRAGIEDRIDIPTG